jgi:predicted O-methyltransferase YrrM
VSDAALNPGSSLRDPRVAGLLERLHGEARRDVLRFVGLAPGALGGLLKRERLFDWFTPERSKDILMPVSPEQGRFLYLTARAIAARTVVEFGTSFGISTLYLASAVRDNGGGVVIGTELIPEKHERAVAHLGEAGLDDVAEVRLGDALQTLQETPEPIDLLLLDGWKDLYRPILDLLTPRLRPGAVVLADNIRTFRKSLRPYVEHVQSGRGGFESTTLSIADGFEYSVRTTARLE